MIAAGLKPDADFAAWRDAARPFLLAEIPPEDIDWVGAAEGSLFGDAVPEPKPGACVYVPSAFVKVAEEAALYNDPTRFDLLYRLAWRLRVVRQLMSDRTDADVERLHRMASGVRREVHKMHAYVRFRTCDEAPDGRFIAWHEPRHFVVGKAAPFFAERFASMAWSILTPLGSAHWDGETLSFSGPARREDAPAADATEDDWRVYYENIFNPARLNVPAMTRHMPRRFWATMPETASIPRLVREAGERASAMIQAAPTIMKKRLNRDEVAQSQQPVLDHDPEALSEIRQMLPDCRRCDLWRNATQPVPGEGPKAATIMLVGEQPGDQEDLAGKPFVGPAGAVLDRALAQAGVDRDMLYVTNAVKHFKYEMKGKRRIHQKPSVGEVRACHAWLAHERRLVSPKIIVALGATALASLKGPKATLKGFRGQMSTEEDGTQFIASYHPSYILRVPDQAAKDHAFAMLVEDLTLARRALA